jgi:hypothetical protein
MLNWRRDPAAEQRRMQLEREQATAANSSDC